MYLLLLPSWHYQVVCHIDQSVPKVSLSSQTRVSYLVALPRVLLVRTALAVIGAVWQNNVLSHCLISRFIA